MSVATTELEFVGSSDEFSSRSGKIRLAHVQLLPILSGVQRVSLDILATLDDSRFERFLICREPGPLSEAATRAGIHCRFVPQMVRPISPLRDAAAYRQLKALFRQEQFGIVHTNSSKPGILGRRAARAAGVPAIVHTVHGFAFPATRSRISRTIYRTAERSCRAATDALICLNENDRAIAVQQLGYAPEQVHVVSNGVDTEKLQPVNDARKREIRQRLGCPDGEFVVAMVGRLWPQKNPMCFVKMATRLIRSGMRAQFYLIGDGELRPELASEIERSGVADRIHLLGWRDDVGQLLPAMDIFVLPSRWEGLPLAILEALACGVPIVASDVPGNRDAVDHDHTGLLAEVDSADAFAGHVTQLLEDNYLRQEFALAARETAVSKFSLESTVKRCSSLYEDLLSN